MQFTIFHYLTLVILILCLGLVCVIIFLKVKQKEIALISYTISVIFTAILTYSLFLTINNFITKASLIRLVYTRDLRHESLVVNGRVQNLTKFDIRKCYLRLTITNKKQTGGEVFDNKNLKNVKMQNTSVFYTIEIIDKLPGNTFKDFSANVPFPPSFINPEFYHTLKCT